MNGKSRSDIEKDIEKEIKELIRNGKGLEAEDINLAIYDMLILDPSEKIELAISICYKGCIYRKEGDSINANSCFETAGAIFDDVGKDKYSNACYQDKIRLVEDSNKIYLKIDDEQ